MDMAHNPVLLHECIEALAIKPDGIYIDGTLGRAGHSLEIAKRLTTGRLIAIDRDETAIEAAQTRLAEFLPRVTLVHRDFRALDQVLNECGVEKIDGISSVKIDSITETNEALTKKKQYSYTITFAYNKVVDANEKASEIEGNQTE